MTILNPGGPIEEDEKVKRFTRVQKMLFLGFMGILILSVGVFIKYYAKRG